MRKVMLIAVILIDLSFSAYVYGQEEKKAKAGDVIIPPGMELKKEGDLNIVIPKGGKLRKEGNMIFIQNAEEYASLGFSAMEKRLDEMEKEQKAQREMIGQLKITVAVLEENLSSKSSP